MSRRPTTNRQRSDTVLVRYQLSTWQVFLFQHGTRARSPEILRSISLASSLVAVWARPCSRLPWPFNKPILHTEEGDISAHTSSCAGLTGLDAMSWALSRTAG